jgi:glycerol kinase
MQFTADILGIDVHAAAGPDCSALGAVLAGMLGTGRCTGLDELSTLPRESQVFAPRMDRRKVQENIDGWKSAVRRVF